jgi:hypothetical protein
MVSENKVSGERRGWRRAINIKKKRRERERTKMIYRN